MANDYDLSYFAARYQDRDRPALWFYERIIRRWILPGTILDFGCGTGFLLRRLAKFYDVTGYDVSLHAASAAKKNLPDLTFYAGIEQIPKAFFSGIVSLHVLEHVEPTSLPSVLTCWYNALLPHGRILCVVPDAAGRGHDLAGDRWTGFGDPSHVSLLGHGEWRDLFASQGFAVCKMGTDGLWCLPYREGKSKIVDGLLFSIPTLIQFMAGRLILPVGSGESAVFLLEKV